MKTLLLKCLGLVGGYQLSRLITSTVPRVLMYHRFSSSAEKGKVSATAFRSHLAKIRRDFTPYTLVDLSKIILSGKKVARNAIVITVDDGYRDFYEIAFPLLKEFQVPATFFVATGFINGDIWLWADKVKWLLGNKDNSLQKLDLGERILDLSDNNKAFQIISDYLLALSNFKKFEFIHNMEKKFELELPQTPPTEYRPCNWSELAEMQDWGIEIGGHSTTHPSLGKIGLDECRDEVNGSYLSITERLGKDERTFCYPNGQVGDYSDLIIKVIEESEYINAVTAFSDKHNLEKPFAWRRFVGTEDSFQFNKSLYGVEHIGNILRFTEKSPI